MWRQEQTRHEWHSGVAEGPAGARPPSAFLGGLATTGEQQARDANGGSPGPGSRPARRLPSFPATEGSLTRRLRPLRAPAASYLAPAAAALLSLLSDTGPCRPPGVSSSCSFAGLNVFFS